MIKSMTGFGRGEYGVEGKRYLVEIKSINHRFTDISIRMPRSFNFLEDKIRQFVLKDISRGKIEVYIFIENLGLEGRSVLVDKALASLYIKELKELNRELDLQDDLTLSSLLRLPEILKVESDNDDDSIWSELSNALDSAIKNLIMMREQEGIKLKNDILNRSNIIKDMVSNIETRAPKVVTEYKERLNNRLKELLDNASIDETRLAMEVAVFADRASICEEVTRLKSHLNQLSMILESKESIGKKLDFLVQEMNREVNTIGSKANDLEITKLVVEAKSEIENIREQIQNIE